MHHIHVCLVSDQPIPSLTTIYQFKPDQVILLTTKEMLTTSKRLAEVIKSRGFKVSTKEIMAYQINDIISVSESIIQQNDGSEISLNITGGTKIGALGAFQVFYSAGKTIHYVNTRGNEILQVSPHESRVAIESVIQIKDYLNTYGFKVSRYLKDDSDIYERKQSTQRLASLAINKPYAIGALNYCLPSNTEKASYPYEVSLPADKVSMLADIFDESIAVISDNRLIVPDEASAVYLMGGWFEEYVYMTVKSLDVDEVRINVEGSWDTVGNIQLKNEFDVMIAKKNRLFYISCKTVNPNRKAENGKEAISKDYLYELDALGDRALGLFGKKLLASARKVTNPYVKKRAQDMGIAFIDGSSIATLKESLRQWLNT